MKIIDARDITQLIRAMCISANIDADPAIRAHLEAIHEQESDGPAKNALGMIIENMDIATRERLPMCQDTGQVVVFVELGQNVHIKGNLSDAIHEGVRQGYKEGYLRASVVGDPLKRHNTQDNTPAVIHYNVVPGSHLTIDVLPKGTGAENKSALTMLTPSQGLAGIEAFVLETVRKAGASACPPFFIGIGIGGTLEKAALMSKQALALDINHANPDPDWATFERNMLTKIDELGIGAMGLKGNKTAMGVNVLTYPTHIGGLPVAVNISCHVSRHRSVTL